jgi:hypothetical protein
MKKTHLAVATLALTGLFASAATTKDIRLDACTKDGKTATLIVDVIGTPSTGADLLKTLQKTWEKTVNPLTGEEVEGYEGWSGTRQNFTDALEILQLVEEDHAGVINALTPPTVGLPACTMK